MSKRNPFHRPAGSPFPRLGHFLFNEYHSCVSFMGSTSSTPVFPAHTDFYLSPFMGLVFAHGTKASSLSYQAHLNSPSPQNGVFHPSRIEVPFERRHKLAVSEFCTKYTFPLQRGPEPGLNAATKLLSLLVALLLFDRSFSHFPNSLNLSLWISLIRYSKLIDIFHGNEP